MKLRNGRIAHLRIYLELWEQEVLLRNSTIISTEAPGIFTNANKSGIFFLSMCSSDYTRPEQF